MRCHQRAVAVRVFDHHDEAYRPGVLSLKRLTFEVGCSVGSLEVRQPPLYLVERDLRWPKEHEISSSSEGIADRQFEGWLKGRMRLADEIVGHAQLPAVPQGRPIGGECLHVDAQADSESDGAQRVEVNACVAVEDTGDSRRRDSRASRDYGHGGRNGSARRLDVASDARGHPLRVSSSLVLRPMESHGDNGAHCPLPGAYRLLTGAYRSVPGRTGAYTGVPRPTGAIPIDRSAVRRLPADWGAASPIFRRSGRLGGPHAPRRRWFDR